MSDKTYICGIFYAEKKGEESNYLNIKGSSSSASFQEIYWKNLIVFFASAYRTNPKANLILFSNSLPPHQEWRESLDKLRVEIINIPYDHNPPKGHWHSWQSTFYIIDCLNYLQSRVKEEDYIYFMDIDCLLLKDLKRLNAVMRKDGFVNYAIDYPVDRKIHGVSRQDMKRSFTQATESNENTNKYPIYFGGELYGFYGKSNIEKIYIEASEAWRRAIVDHNMTFNTEEHLLTYVFWKIKEDHNNAYNFIKRIWTDSSNYRNVQKEDLELTIWHLPAEKNKGINTLFKEVLNEQSNFWRADLIDYNRYLGKFVSIPKRNVNRFMIENCKKITKKIIRRS